MTDSVLWLHITVPWVRLKCVIPGLGGGGWGYSDVFIYTWARTFFWGSKFLILIFLEVFRKMNISWGMIICGYFFFFFFFLGGGGSSQNWAIFWCHLCTL